MEREHAPSDESPAQALVRAIGVAGGQSAFGRIIKRRQSTVSDWVRLGKALPAEHVLDAERETGVSRSALRPDIYPREQRFLGVDQDALRAAHA